MDLALVQAEADGSECFLCGDRIFLDAWRLAVFWGETKAGEATELICGSCVDVIEIEKSG